MTSVTFCMIDNFRDTHEEQLIIGEKYLLGITVSKIENLFMQLVL